MKTIKLLVLLVSFGSLLSSCNTTSVTDQSTNQSAANDTLIQTYLRKNNLTASKTTAGAYYVLTQANASGKSVSVGDQIVFNYVASLLDGTIISKTFKDSSAKITYGVSYNLPAGAVVDAMSYLHVGENASIILPSSLAYGSASSSLIPAYSVIKYDVKILAFNSEIQQIRNYIPTDSTLKGKTVDTTASGLRHIRTVAGTDSIKVGQTVSVNYTGKLLDGTQFDAGTFSFVLGAGAVVKGFDEGVSLMKVDETATLIFPSSIGYGSSGNNVIPPYSPLIFIVKVLSAK